MNGSQVVVVVVAVAAAGVELLLLSLTHGQRETPAQAYYNNAIALVCLYWENDALIDTTEYYVVVVCSLAINHGVLALISSLSLSLFCCAWTSRVVSCNLLIELMPYCYYLY